MKKFILFILVAICCVHDTQAQGTLRGKITDNNGEGLIGASVMLKSNKSIGCVTDFDGNYSLKIPVSGAQQIVVSYVSYNTIEESVTLQNNEVIVKNFIMKTSAQEMKSVEVVAKAVRAKDYYMEKMKMNAAATLDYVSSETMKKTGDANVSAAVARVAGVSTNGSFITVRGIGDRYVKTAINGSRIPTLDPFTNNIKLDLFPSSLVDNILITKTASADLPGDWAGAYLSVETKDFPERLAINVETSFGYNTNSSFKSTLTSPTSSTDWLGYDDGLRDFNHGGFVDAKPSPTTYEEMVALGLGDYYASIGVDKTTPWNETYFRLGLIQLGLLAPALIDDPTAVATAKTAYLDGSYQSDAFKVINANVPSSVSGLANNWNVSYKKAPLNFSQSFSIGNQTNLGKHQLGYLFGFRYGSNVQYDGEATSSRAAVANDENGNLVRSLSSKLDQEVSRESNGWSALCNMAYKINEHHSFSLMFMPNLTGTNSVRSSIDTREAANYVITKSQFYEQRRQLIYQLKSENYLAAYKTKLETNISFTDGKSSAPDFKNLQYLKDPIANTYQIGGIIGEGIHRYFRYLTDRLFDGRIAAEWPIGKNSKLTRKIKLGGAFQWNDRESNQYDYAVNFGPASYLLTNEDVNAYLSPDKFNIREGVDANGTYSTLDLYYTSYNSPANNTIGNSHVWAGFAMTDYTLTERVRLTGGVRVERSEVFTDVKLFDKLDYAANDPRRNYKEGLPIANPASLNETSFLPSINVIYKLRNDEDYPTNLRLNYSQTVARPSIRELSDVANFDFEYRSFVFGNSDLKSVRIANYDARIESFFPGGNDASLSFFFKDFRNHIELVNSIGYSWQNVDKSWVAGIELEGRKKIYKSFEFRANITLANSVTEYVRKSLIIDNGIKTYLPVDTISRTMFGQAPYVINGILSYSADSLGLTASLSYNLQGPRLVVAADVKEIPDIYELPRNVLDLKVTKKIGKYFAMSFTVKDILNEPVRRSYDYAEGWIVDYDRYQYGTNYILSLSYKL